MKMLLEYIISICIIFMASCIKPPVIEPNDSNLSIVWKTPIGHDTTVGCYTASPFIYDSKVVFGGNSCETSMNGFRAFDKSNGQIISEWLGMPVDNWVAPKNHEKPIVGIPYGWELFAVNLSNGKELWNNVDPSKTFSPRCGRFGNYLFMQEDKKNGQETLWVTLSRYEAETGTRKDLLVLHQTNGYEPDIENETGWISPLGDTIIIFQSRQYNFVNPDGKVDIYAFNMNADSIFWIIDDITITGNSSILPIQIEGDLAYFQGSKSIHCIDLLNGIIVWEDQSLGVEGFFQAENLVADGKVFMNGDSYYVYSYDAISGQQLWKSEVCTSSSGTMAWYDDKLYLSGGDHDGYWYLYCLDAQTGSILWKERPAHGGLIIDQQKGYLYYTDGVFVYCADLNKTP